MSVTRALKMSVEGLNQEDLDNPLPDTIQRQAETTLTSYYSFPVVPRKFAAETLLGRIQREFTRQQPSMLEVTRVRTVATVQRTGMG